jgi:hypothetical protein
VPHTRTVNAIIRRKHAQQVPVDLRSRAKRHDDKAIASIVQHLLAPGPRSARRLAVPRGAPFVQDENSASVLQAG